MGKVKRRGDQVIIHRNGKKVVMDAFEFDVRVDQVLAHQNKKYKPGERDHLGGIPREMNDPDSPFPKSTTTRVLERWHPSGASTNPQVSGTTMKLDVPKKKPFKFKPGLRKW